jgi:predicted nucleic acid-binding protein
VILVFDSSSLIALARVGRLDLIRGFAEEVHVPTAVFDEVAAQGEGRVGSSELRLASWIRVGRAADQRAVEHLRGRLGRGEAESIVLARELSADFVVLDDATARRAAEREGVHVVGLLGLLVHAKERGMIPALKPLLDELRDAGFHVADSLYRGLLRRVGEA